MAGGKPGDYPDFVSGKDGIPHPVPFNYFVPFKLSSKMSAESKEKRLVMEINNGRLAQIGILGFLSEQVAPGSVALPFYAPPPTTNGHCHTTTNSKGTSTSSSSSSSNNNNQPPPRRLLIHLLLL
jgi:cytoskeletal protein RodZ